MDGFYNKKGRSRHNYNAQYTVYVYVPKRMRLCLSEQSIHIAFLYMYGDEKEK